MYKQNKDTGMEVRCKQESGLYHAYHIVKAFFPSKKIDGRVEEEASAYIRVLEEGVPLLIQEGEPREGETENAFRFRMETEFYDKLSDLTGRSLAWGKLSGVRPTKLAMRQLEAGMEEEAFSDWFFETYRVEKEKGNLAWQIAQKEKKILGRLDKEGYSLYVGIPFCPSICSYCSFGSGTWEVWKEQSDQYVEALLKELQGIGEIQKEKILNTIYIGGGTPTTLGARQLRTLFEAIERYFPNRNLLEYTVEAGRPDSITKEKLEVMREFPITRISINPQTMQQETLNRIGRRHKVEEIVDTFFWARDLGFQNINMDLILGLEGEGDREVESTLEQIAALEPDSLTVHALSIKKKSTVGRARFF